MQLYVTSLLKIPKLFSKVKLYCLLNQVIFVKIETDCKYFDLGRQKI